MKKVAVIFESSPFDRKGLFNSAHNRTLHLVETGEVQLDAYCMHIRDSFITRKLRHTPKVPVRKTVTIDGVSYNMMWRRFFWTDRVRKIFGCAPKRLYAYISKQVEKFSGYDAIIAHSYEGGLLAYEVNRRHGIPYMVTWHGSDVHTHPLRDVERLKMTARIMDRAQVNFFVSTALMAASEKITENARKEVLYNGVNTLFSALSEDDRTAVRRRYGVGPEDRVIAYVGNFYPVKNVDVLPEIFAAVQDDFELHLRDNPQLSMNLKFWVIGDGRLRKEVEHRIKLQSSTNVNFYGNVPVEEMPRMMNCIDLLVLPSRNEGLPLVTMEALRCGASVIGSDVGGIPEVIGKEFCVPFNVKLDGSLEYGDKDFVNRFSQKVVRQLFFPKDQLLDECFDWKKTARKELGFL